MEQYYRIANDSKVYDAKFDSLQEAKNWMFAHNLPDVMHDLIESNYGGWRIERMENKKMVCFYPFSYQFDSLSLEENFKFGDCFIM